MELFFGYLNLLLSSVGRLIVSEFIVTDEVISERVGIHTADKGRRDPWTVYAFEGKPRCCKDVH